MYTTIPYEDVQAAATQLIQCAANVLSVRNRNNYYLQLVYKK
jgi:hypothetical protein